VCCSLPTPCIVKKTFEAARDSGNALLAQVKANQPGLLATL
jgi:predicted transposase YbfD/YdcC